MRLNTIPIAIALAGLLAGCGAARPNKYFQLTVPGDAAAAADPEPFPVTLLIGPLRASHLYREDHIVFSSAGQSMGTYEYERWSEPPAEMLVRRPDLPRHMEGGPANPLGARAMYLGSSLYRIHGSNEPWTIGTNVSSGCIRMRNEDVIDLYGRVNVGTRVIVL